MQKKVIAAAAIIGALAVVQPLDKAEAKTDVYFGIGFGGPIVHHVHTPPRYRYNHGYNRKYYNYKPAHVSPRKKAFRKLRHRGFHHFRDVRWRNGVWRMTAVSPRGHLVRLKVDRRGHILKRKIVRYYY